MLKRIICMFLDHSLEITNKEFLPGYSPGKGILTKVTLKCRRCGIKKEETKLT